MRIVMLLIGLPVTLSVSAAGSVNKYDLAVANNLLALPVTCIIQEYPNKLNQVIDDSSDLKEPKDLHPAFYGCFDWHSSVHGHWSIIRLLKDFPELDVNDSIMNKLTENINTANINQEIIYFEDPVNNGYERMYGWAWLFKLACELKLLDHPKAIEMSEALQPLVEIVANKTINFLPKLNYAIRVGTHTNTAFALSLCYDYALDFHDTTLQRSIEERAKFFYMNDVGCPLKWEPSGYDFLSPCLEEAYLMAKILDVNTYSIWLKNFLPELAMPDFELDPGRVSDRSDGHLVHLDGLNFSRAWCLYGIAKALPEYSHLFRIADQHVEYSLNNLIDDSYEGGHWLASFALRALSD